MIAMSHHNHPSHDASQSQEHGHGELTDTMREHGEVANEHAHTADETKAGLK
jgi:hypothetical protein